MLVDLHNGPEESFQYLLLASAWTLDNGSHCSLKSAAVLTTFCHIVTVLAADDIISKLKKFAPFKLSQHPPKESTMGSSLIPVLKREWGSGSL